MLHSLTHTGLRRIRATGLFRHVVRAPSSRPNDKLSSKNLRALQLTLLRTTPNTM